MVYNHGRGGHSTKEGVKVENVLHCKRMSHTHKNWYSLHGFPNKITNISKYEIVKPKFPNEEYQEYLRLKTNSLVQSSTIRQQLGFHNLWKVKVHG